ncbi:1-acyl-sn-glycerol-3-phosphate acyltransferase [Actinoplanes palleronii]|uniref:1-acyl-sn-glycerol-3-phosphate acyltransferase n=2 Tax=Actinoplanes palleronii TaxID=113570 RepID=A0ABQ4BBI1_9ACTN|nr:lysophospholipid acyltransferase family protein [Actinoplanes palleronii]GIE67994.1 1-acyl-sn-glycerol-3-phosphate acyltransferase [Actinoplanes palleronii]
MTRMPPLYASAHRTLGILLRGLWPTTVTGLENLPATGAILAANHHAIADQLFLGINTPRHIAFWAKAEYFRGDGLVGGLTRRVVTGMGAIPVERAGGRAVLTAFDAAVPILRGGGLVAVFPEGTRSPDGRLYRGRTGAVRLAAQAGVPVVPIGIRGTDHIRRAGDRFPRPQAISLAFGTPIPVKVESAPDARRLTDELIAAIQALTGQEYAGSYAPIRHG